MGVYSQLHRARGAELTRVLLDEFVDAGVLRRIQRWYQVTLLTASAIFLLEAWNALQRCSFGTIVFGHFVAILRGSDDGDIRFGRDVVAHVALGHVSIQLADDLQINRAIRTNHVTTRESFFQHFLQQETQSRGGGQGNDLIIAGDFCQRLIGTLIGTINAGGVVGLDPAVAV